MVIIKKREGESTSALLFRFSRRIKQSGVLKEAKKRRFRGRAVGRRARRISAGHRERKRAELLRLKRLGLL